MGKGGGNLDPAVQQGMLNNESALVNIAQQQANQSGQLFGLSFPGVQRATEYYSALSSGDPAAIARAIAPVAESSNTAAAAAKANILNNGPAGGEKTLALEQVDVNRGAEIAKAASAGFGGSFNALASLGGQNIGQSQNAASLGISGLNSANQSLSSYQGLQFQGQQLQAEQKGNTLGALSSLGAGLAGGIGEAGSIGAFFA